MINIQRITKPAADKQSAKSANQSTGKGGIQPTERIAPLKNTNAEDDDTKKNKKAVEPEANINQDQTSSSEIDSDKTIKPDLSQASDPDEMVYDEHGKKAAVNSIDIRV